MNRRNRNNRRNNNQKPPEGNYLYGSFDLLLKECRRLEARVRYLERELGRQEVNDENDGDVYTSWVEETDNKRYDEEYPKVDLKAAHRRNTSDLYKEAKEKHEESAKRKRLEQENRDIIEDEQESRPLDVVISENKQQYYIEKAKAVTGLPGR